MKIKQFACLITAIVCAVVGFADRSFAQYTNIYLDDFTTADTALQGHAPAPTDSGAATWSANAANSTTWTIGGDILTVTTPNSTALNNGAMALLPATLALNTSYKLSVDVVSIALTASSSTARWMGIGFWTNAPSSSLGAFTAGVDEMAFLLVSTDNSSSQSFYGTGNVANGATHAGNGGAANYAIVINVDGTGAATVQFFRNGVSLRVVSMVATDVAKIRSVGISLNRNTKTVLDNYKLETVAAPAGPSDLTISPASTNVYSGVPVTLSASASGATPLFYQWQCDGGTGVTFTNIPNATNTTLQVDTTPISGTWQYQFIVTNSINSATSTVAQVTANQTAPVVATDTAPLTRTSYTGKAAKFSASFTGSTPMTNVWQHSPNADGSGATTLTTQTNSTLILNNLALGDAGYYSLQSANAFGTANSSWAQLIVLNSATQTSGLWIDSFSRTGALNGSAPDVVDTGSLLWGAPVGWTNSGAEVRVSGVASAGTIASIPFKPAVSNVYQVSFDILSLTGSAANWIGLGFWSSTNSADFVFSKAVAFALQRVNGNGENFFGDPGLNNDSGDTGGLGGVGSYAIKLTVLSSGSAVVKFYRDGVELRTGSLTSVQVANIAGVGLSGQNGITATIDNFRVETLPFPPLPTPGTPTIAPSATVYAGSPVTLSIASGGAQPLHYQWQTDSGTGGATFTDVGVNSTNLTVDTTALSGSYQYQVIITNSFGSATSQTVTLTVNAASAPILTNGKDTRPACAQDVPIGQPVSFLARFEGTLPIAYQWQFSANSDGSNSQDLSGQTNFTLVIANAQLTNAGYYSLRATNTLGSANSTWSQLTVHAGVNQLSFPANRTNIYYDSFTHVAGNLAFTSPDTINIPNEEWYGLNGSFGLDGDQLTLNNSSVATLALTPAANRTYLVSALLLPACGNGASTATLGFNVNFHNFPGNAGWITYASANGDGTGASYAGDSAATGTGVANTNGGVATYYVQLAVSSDGSGTVIYARNTEAYATNTLTTAQVSSIRSVAVSGTTSAADDLKLAIYPVINPTISIQSSGANVQLIWSGGILLEATNLLGPWTTNSSTSPLTFSPTEPQKFYRVLGQ